MSRAVPAQPDAVSPIIGVGRARRRIRISIREVEAGRDRIEAWFGKRREADAQLQKSSTQLGALERSLLGALERLLHTLGSLAATEQSLTDAYDACRLHDVRLAWILRTWLWFRRKFDQSDDPELAPILRAADEVLWSCYQVAFENSGQPRPTAPLPFVEPLYSPNALTRDLRPGELQQEIDAAFLAECLTAMPVPTTALPSVCVRQPWWLVLLAHEAGHHVQHDLRGDSGSLVEPFGARLRAAAAAAVQGGLPELKPQAWFRRGQEVFADIYSVLCCGPAAAYAMSEFLMAGPAEMNAAPDARYPAPVARLQILALAARGLRLANSTAEVLGTERAEAIEALLGETASPDAALRQTASDLKFADQAVATALEWTACAPLRFPELVGWRQQAEGWSSEGWHNGQGGMAASVPSWHETFKAGLMPTAPSALASPRNVLAAGVLAWRDLDGIEDDALRAEALAGLAEGLPGAVFQAREPGVRAAAEADTEAFAECLFGEANRQALRGTSTGPGEDEEERG